MVSATWGLRGKERKQTFPRAAMERKTEERVGRGTVCECAGPMATHFREEASWGSRATGRDWMANVGRKMRMVRKHMNSSKGGSEPSGKPEPD